MVQKYYAVRKNLLIKFVDDSIDETSDLAATLAGAEAAEDVDLTVRAKPGDHVFPLWRDTGIDVPDEVYEVAEQGGDMLAAFGDAFGLKADDSPLGLLREGFDNARRQAREAENVSRLIRRPRAHGRSRRRNHRVDVTRHPSQRALARSRVPSL